MTTFQKQMIEAALWTFVETFLSVGAAGVVGIEVGDFNALGTLAVTAGIAGLAAVVSLVKSKLVKNVGPNPEPSVFIES